MRFLPHTRSYETQESVNTLWMSSEVHFEGANLVHDATATILHPSLMGDDEGYVSLSDSDMLDDTSKDDDTTSNSLFGESVVSLIGKRSIEVQEFMSRLRAQELCLAYEQGKIQDFELKKLPVITNDQGIRSISFGPCMTYKQAADCIREKQQMSSKSMNQPMTGHNTQAVGSDKKNGPPRKIQQRSMEQKADLAHSSQQQMRPCSAAHRSFSWNIQRPNGIFKVRNNAMQVRSSASKGVRDLLNTSELVSFSSQASVAPTEPESPMSCAGTFSAFC
jgi:hypothetical protein